MVIWEHSIDWVGKNGFRFDFAALPNTLAQVQQKADGTASAIMQRLAKCSSAQLRLCLALLAGAKGCDFSNIPGCSWSQATSALCKLDGDVTPELFINSLFSVIEGDKETALRDVNIAVDCFLHPFVYDKSGFPVKQMVTLSGRPPSEMTNKPHLGCAPFGAAVQQRMLGLLDPRSDTPETLRDLIALHQLHLDGMRDTIEIPHFLLPGAAFLTHHTAENAQSPDLVTFLKCRAFTKIPTTKAERLSRVKALLDLDVANTFRDRSYQVPYCDPHGACVVYLILSSGLVKTPPQHDAGLTPPQQKDGAWLQLTDTTDKSTVVKVTAEFLRSKFITTKLKSMSSKTMDDALAALQSFHYIPGFALARTKEGVWIRGQLFPSMRALLYSVHVLVEVDIGESVVGIIKAQCACMAKNSFVCHHVCALLMAVCSLHFDLGMPIPCTSKPRAWGIVKQRTDEEGLISKDICYLPLTKTVYKVEGAEPRKSRAYDTKKTPVLTSPRKAEPIEPGRRSVDNYNAVRPEFQQWVPDSNLVWKWVTSIPDFQHTSVYIAYGEHYNPTPQPSLPPSLLPSLPPSLPR